jgi:hypothetical protein
MSNDYNEGFPIGKIFLGFILLVIIVLGGDWIATGNDFFIYKYFAPKQAAVQRQVFENTPSFNKGQIQELENMQFEYTQQKDPQAKAALASIILHRASGYNLNDPDVSQDLRDFIQSLKDKQNASDIK